MNRFSVFTLPDAQQLTTLEPGFRQVSSTFAPSVVPLCVVDNPALPTAGERFVFLPIAASDVDRALSPEAHALLQAGFADVRAGRVRTIDLSELEISDEE